MPKTIVNDSKPVAGPLLIEAKIPIKVNIVIGFAIVSKNTSIIKCSFDLLLTVVLFTALCVDDFSSL